MGALPTSISEEGLCAGIRIAVLSTARANSKTTLAAALAAASVIPDYSPLHARYGQVVLVASSKDQAAIGFEVAESFLADLGSERLAKDYRIIKAASQRPSIEHRATNARLVVIGSDARRAHGLGLDLTLALLDEPAQWVGGGARLWQAIRTSLGKNPDARILIFGTQPDDPEHWQAKLLRSTDPSVYVQLHAATDDDDPFAWRTIRKANPLLDYVPALRATLDAERREAKQDPAALASWNALRLNLGTPDIEHDVLIDAGVWCQRAETDTPPPRDGQPIWGCDFGSSRSLSAIAAYWQSGRLEVIGAFPGQPDLEVRERRDGRVSTQLYRRLAREGFLHLVGSGESMPIDQLLQIAADTFDGPPTAIVADRWRQAEVSDAVAAAKLLTAAPSWRGQGFKDQGEDVRLFRKAILEGRVQSRPSTLLRASLRDTRMASDPAGNEKLVKAARGRRMDDAAIAGLLAVAEGERSRGIRAWTYYTV